MPKNKQQEDYARAHNSLLEALTFLVMLPINVVVVFPLKGIVGLHYALAGKAERAPGQYKNDRNLN